MVEKQLQYIPKEDGTTLELHGRFHINPRNLPSCGALLIHF